MKFNILLSAKMEHFLKMRLDIDVICISVQLLQFMNMTLQVERSVVARAKRMPKDDMHFI